MVTGSISVLRVSKTLRNFRWSPISIALATQGKYFLMLSSIGIGAMFSPPKIRNVLVCRACAQYENFTFGLQPVLKFPILNLWQFWHSNCGFLSKISKEIEWPNQILSRQSQFCVIFNCWSCGKKTWSTIENYAKLGPSWQNLVWPFNFFSNFALETTIRMSKLSEVWDWQFQ